MKALNAHEAYIQALTTYSVHSDPEVVKFWTKEPENNLNRKADELWQFIEALLPADMVEKIKEAESKQSVDPLS